MKNLLTWILAVLLLTSCTKVQETFRKSGKSGFTTYTIKAGNHYCDQSTIKSVSGTEMTFVVKFDSSAIYTSKDPVNQWDQNKLWGFREGATETNSARVGWNWREGALRLHPYTHVNGVINYDIGEISVPIGQEIPCSIRVSGNTYVFTINGQTWVTPRGKSGSTFSGYQLYPYFGGDETAPHKISIQIR